MMKSKEIRQYFQDIADGVQTREFDRARSLARTLFNGLLKTVYAQVRGQASAATMRHLLEREIEIGGENGDFRDFDDGQMIDLFTRGEVAGHLQRHMAPESSLSASVNIQAVARWFDPGTHETDAKSQASVRFVHAWLRLFAEEAGILEPEEDSPAERRGFSDTVQNTVATVLNVGKPYTDPITGINFVRVPGGAFSMGDTFDDGVEDEKPVHEVTLSDFYMAACPVTQAQWKCLMAENPSSFVADDHPVEQVTLNDVQAFIDKLNAASKSGLHFSLPSEAQWEYAARSGGKRELYAGGQDPEAVAWFDENSSGGSAPVAGKAPNGLGLYDMSGNVWEWCLDLYHADAYRRHSKMDPICTTGETDRVIRGGSWHLDAWSARCSRRFRFDPELYGPALGFRVVMIRVG